MKLLAIALAAVAPFALSADAKAALISYEGFNYEPGTGIAGKAGTGWAGNWIGGGAANAAPGSLSYPVGSDYAGTGNHLETGAGVVSVFINYGVDFRFTMETDTVRYASVLVTKPAGTTGVYTQVDLSTGAAQLWSFGISGNGFFVRTKDDGGNLVNASSFTTVTTDASYLLISKLVTSSTGNDRVYLSWFSVTDPVPRSEPETWMLSVEADNSSTVNNTTLFLIPGAGATSYLYDEIRLGTTYADVAPIPEPAAISLLGLALLGGMLVRRSRRRGEAATEVANKAQTLVAAVALLLMPSGLMANLLENPGFEAGVGGAMTDWQPRNEGPSATTAVIELDSGEPFEGQQTLKISNSVLQVGCPEVFQKVEVKPNTRYRLTFHARTENIESMEGGAPRVYINGDEPEKDDLGLMNITSPEWQRFTLIFDTRGNSAIIVRCYLHNSTGTVWFDDLKLEEEA